ncbi:MAG: PEGA domain-containing protein [Chitinivibrionia bacterium]|nr:PEGA domain-containing protein [Chitinivibrionia bacterium]
MKKLAIFICLLFNLIFCAQREFVREYSYVASEYDSKVTARDNAVDQMRAVLLREIGQVVIAEQRMESASRSNEFIYDNYSEKITAITASMVKMEILQEKWDGQKYYVRAKMLIDPSEVSKKASEVLMNQKEMKTLQDKNRDISQEVEKLNKEISNIKGRMQRNENFLFAEINEYKMQISDYLGQIAQLKRINSEVQTKYNSDLSQKDSIINSLNLMVAELKEMQAKLANEKPQVVEKIVEREVKVSAIQESSDEIYITTKPAGALIYVNDKYVGRTPYSYKNAPHGKIAVRVKPSGFEPHTWNINYYGGKVSLNKTFP